MENLTAQIESVLVELRPYTRFIPYEIQSIGAKIIGPDAFQVLIMELDPLSPTGLVFFRSAVSKVLGLGLIGGSSIVKLPQIISVIKSRSAKGVSLLTNLLESICYLVSLAYNLRLGTPFLAFGEVTFLLVQNLFLAVLLLGFSGRYGYFQFFFTFVSGLLYSFLAQPGPDRPLVISDKLLNYLQSVIVPLSGLSKIPQVLEIFKTKSKGQLSSVTVISNLLASLARIFTTLSSGINDNAMLAGYVIAGLVNIVLGVQLVLYGTRRVKVKTK